MTNVLGDKAAASGFLNAKGGTNRAVRPEQSFQGCQRRNDIAHGVNECQ